jgi:hypothetical protein
VIILSQGHLKRLLKEFIEEYYHIARSHQGLDGDTPFSTNMTEPVTEPSRLLSFPVVGGLHHRYIRLAA